MKMERKVNEDQIAKLQYKLQRYKSMGCGTVCQSITAKIHKLQAQQING